MSELISDELNLHVVHVRYHARDCSVNLALLEVFRQAERTPRQSLQEASLVEEQSELRNVPANS